MHEDTPAHDPKQKSNREHSYMIYTQRISTQPRRRRTDSFYSKHNKRSGIPTQFEKRLRDGTNALSNDARSTHRRGRPFSDRTPETKLLNRTKQLAVADEMRRNLATQNVVQDTNASARVVLHELGINVLQRTERLRLPVNHELARPPLANAAEENSTKPIRARDTIEGPSTRTIRMVRSVLHVMTRQSIHVSRPQNQPQASAR